MNSTLLRQQIETDGYAVLENVFSPSEMEELAHVMEAARHGGQEQETGSRKVQKAHGARNLLELVPAIRALAACTAMRNLTTAVLRKGCFAVRGLWFDKVAGANWKVPWHQDVSIAVRERLDVDGYGPWTCKSGVTHAHAPSGLLERMLTLRLHLDDCDENNGPLRVLPGTHRLGKLSMVQIQEQQAIRGAVSCLASCGSVVVMRPLLLHASSPAQSPLHRRVIHLEYAAESLPGGLQWHSQIGISCKGEKR